MYKVIKIHETVATRTIELLNKETGTMDICFDDSSLVSDENFDFMENGKDYECKIKLFGRYAETKTSDSKVCKIVNREITVGVKKLVEVLIDKDIYYVYENKIPAEYTEDIFFFEFTRKDLIQVNDVLHDDLLY